MFLPSVSMASWFASSQLSAHNTSSMTTRFQAATLATPCEDGMTYSGVHGDGAVRKATVLESFRCLALIEASLVETSRWSSSRQEKSSAG